jgi:hypothetical protein
MVDGPRIGIERCSIPLVKEWRERDWAAPKAAYVFFQALTFFNSFKR